MPSSRSPSLSRFHPELANWFAEYIGEPTEVQSEAWHRIAAGAHCLITAATGSGKTMAAFLWAINQLVSGSWELGQTRVIYISPLKALNNDIQRNLLGPLNELKERFLRRNQPWPDIRVKVRSGDTEQVDRRRMLRHPPEILITTPESLNLLLTSPDGQRSLLGVKTVILDEIHSVVGSKRGVYLMTAVERLAHLSGEFQRVALSATVRPIETVAAFVGGYHLGRPRPLALAESKAPKHYHIEIRRPPPGQSAEDEEDTWLPIVNDLKSVIAANRSTLVFVNSRMLCEKITHKLNSGEEHPIAYSHHGSLSKEIRTAVEQRLKRGELKAIVATNSLEMGIDIGSLDCVVMIQSPNSISSAIQKIGRAGHQVGAESRGTLYPSHSRDLLESAVLSQAIHERAIEPTRPVEGPLDVLAQIIVSMLGSGSWELDAMFSLIRSSYPYRNLAREHFDLVAQMLAGRYAGTRLRELKPRVAIDRSANSITLRRGALMAYYFSGGVIPDRGYFHLRHSGSGSKLGELDEEFVWERKVGDIFSLGVQSWKIDRITFNDVFVVPAESRGLAPPFWRSETYNRDFHFSCRIGDFLAWADERLNRHDFTADLQKRCRLQSEAAEALHDFLRLQKKATNRALPHRRHIVAEIVDAAPAGAPGKQLVLHTHWGGQVNRPYALALDAAWFETFGHRTEIYVNNDCVVVMLHDTVSVEEVIGLVTAGNVESWLRQRLESSGFFGARFREAAGTSLLITRNRAGQRLPLWLSRMQAKKLLESVQRYDDFPLLLEAWRSCLKDEFDMEGLQQVLVELEQGEIHVSTTTCSVASPFASSVAWRQINDEYMYATDNPNAAGKSNLREDLVRSIAFDQAARPRLPTELVASFEAKRQRLAAGYQPADALELREWLRDRIVLPLSEWERLTPVAETEVATQRLERSDGVWVCLEDEAELAHAFFSGQEEAVAQWLSYFGPVSIDKLRNLLGIEPASFAALIDSMADEQRVTLGQLIEGSEEVWVCDGPNYEALLRLLRARNRPTLNPLPADDLALFLAQWQGVAAPQPDATLEQALDRLVGFAAPVEEWENSLLPARLPNFQSAWIDAALSEEGYVWHGAGIGRVGFCLEDDLDLIPTGGDDAVEPPAQSLWQLLVGSGARYSSARLASVLDLSPAELEASLWSLVWSGKASNDSFAAARRGAANNFQLAQHLAKASSRPTHPRRSRRPRPAAVLTYPGAWFALSVPCVNETVDPVSELERQKDRARCLLERYGVVFRELLLRELLGFRWSDVFKALRLMELSGEIVGGRFFEGVEGLQFASLPALRVLRAGLPRSSIYWLSATDPASICGLGIDGLSAPLPKRLVSSRLVYRGSELVMEAQRQGKTLTFHVPASDIDLPAILTVLEPLLSRGGSRLPQLRLESINGEDARASAYLPALEARFRLHCDHKQVVIEGPRPSSPHST